MKHSNTPLEVQIPFLKGGSPAYNYYIFDSPAPHTYNVHNNQLLRMECAFLQKKKIKTNIDACIPALENYFCQLPQKLADKSEILEKCWIYLDLF